MRSISVLPAVTLMCLAATVVRAQDVCEAFARYGVFDTVVSQSATDKSESFRTWFCQSRFESKASADAAGGSLGYTGFTASLNSENKDWSEFRDDYCRDDSFASTYRNRTASFVQTINATASNNMLACFQRSGLHMRVIPGAGPRVFYVQARYTSDGNTPSATISFFGISGASCEGPIRAGAQITGATSELLCTRAGNAPVDITVSASRDVRWNSPRGLPAVYTPPPPPVRQVIEVRAMDFVNGTNVAIDACVVGPGTLANAAPCTDRPNAAEFVMRATAGGRYRLDVNYAAASSRPVRVMVNGVPVRDNALSSVTGGWENSWLRWVEVGTVELRQGENRIRLERAGVFPHIHDLRLTPAP
jgi:hypothetical protein